MKQHDEAPKGGRPEALTEVLARKISKMIERMPDAEIPVTWDNVALHVKQKFGHEFRRNVLSQKSWNGRKLIAEAFSEAKEVQRRMLRQQAPKHATSTRSALRGRIAALEAKVLALQEELEATRAHHYDELLVLWGQNTPLHKLLEPA